MAGLPKTHRYLEDESYIHLQSLDAIYLDVSDNENVVVFDTDVGLKS